MLLWVQKLAFLLPVYFFTSLAAGGVTFLAPLGFAAYKIYKKKKRAEFIDPNISLSEDSFKNVSSWDCFWATIAVVGHERTGKTTLKKRLRGEDYRKFTGRTEQIDITIAKLDNNTDEQTFLCILDSAGEGKVHGTKMQEALIYLAAKTVDVIVIVYDHAETRGEDSDTRLLDEGRLSSHERFNKKIVFPALKSYETEKDPTKFNELPTLREIILIMNKTDCWQGGDSEETIAEWFNNQVEYFDDKYRPNVSGFLMSIWNDSDESESYKNFKEILERYSISITQEKKNKRL